MGDQLIVRPPASEAEFEEYFDLRWRVLRAAWGQPRGSERDELEMASGVYHGAAFLNSRLIGAGRLHPLEESAAQIRYMAVEPELAGQGAGSAILAKLEQHAQEQHFRELRLNARDSAVSFYLKHGYQIMGEGPLVFGLIRHKMLHKRLTKWENH